MMLTLGHTCRWEAQHHPSLMYQSGCTIEWKGHLRPVRMKCGVSATHGILPFVRRKRVD